MWESEMSPPPEKGETLLGQYVYSYDWNSFIHVVNNIKKTKKRTIKCEEFSRETIAKGLIHVFPFEDQYSPRKLGNWEHPKWYPERPRQRFKSTKVIADDNGCLLEGIKKENPWGNYVGTWELPRRITREYVNKLVAPPERLVKLWGKKKKETEPEEAKAEPEEPQEKKQEDVICTMCGRLLSECTCPRQSKSKSCDSGEQEICHETLNCAKCNRDLCLCEDACCCPT